MIFFNEKKEKTKSSPGVNDIPLIVPQSNSPQHHQWHQERDVIFVNVLKTEKPGSCAFFVRDQCVGNTTVK